MIHPDLATMLAVVTTDYPLEPARRSSSSGRGRDELQRDHGRRRASTNDCVILLANGASGAGRATTRRSPAALNEVCADLARQVVADGEGSPCSPRSPSPAPRTTSQAKAVARRIATSPLVKTALFGHDANWGRVLMAAGSAPFNGGYANVDPARITLAYNGTTVLDAGVPTDAEPDVAGPSCTIELDLGLGAGSASYLTSDLSYDYVKINADYRT